MKLMSTFWPSRLFTSWMKTNTNAAASENSTSPLSMPFSPGAGKSALAELEAEQDDDEIDDGLDRDMHRKGRAAKRRADRPVHNKRIECRQNAGDHRARQRAARQAIDGERGLPPCKTRLSA